MKYVLGKEYVDRGNPRDKEDQFMGWLNIPGVTGMMNSPGIRWLNYEKRKELPAVIVLVTKTVAGSYHNPWDDVVDLNHGMIAYWGDAKHHPTKKCEEFNGNKVLKKVFDAVLENRLSEVPPILHFSKPARGMVIFNGLCVIDRLDLDWFEDKGKPVRNYRLLLTVLDTPEVSIEWLHDRVRLQKNPGPKAWSEYQKGKVKPFKIWKKQILTRQDQLPSVGTTDYEILEKIHNLTPDQFEKLSVQMMRQIKGVRHEITKTRKTRDGGFDFFGTFTLPTPLRYTIQLKGEAKKYHPNSVVGAKDLSRLAARLNRGEYGVFITTSHYSKQAQEELYEDSYPLRLLSGNDVVQMLREFKLISNGKLTAKFHIIISDDEKSS